MQEIRVGGFLPQFAGRGEGVFFEAGGSGFTLVYLFGNPRPDEIAAVGEGQGFEIRYLVRDGIIWILTKCGSLAWTDAPYSPHMSAGVSELIDPIEESQGTALTLMMVDAITTEIKSLRMIGLGHAFSRALYRDIHAELAKPFRQDYYRRVAAAQAAYSTRDFVRMAAANRWRL